MNNLSNRGGVGCEVGTQGGPDCLLLKLRLSGFAQHCLLEGVEAQPFRIYLENAQTYPLFEVVYTPGGAASLTVPKKRKKGGNDLEFLP